MFGADRPGGVTFRATAAPSSTADFDAQSSTSLPFHGCHSWTAFSRANHFSPLVKAMHAPNVTTEMSVLIRIVASDSSV
jgi:hypothetical protein